MASLLIAVIYIIFISLGLPDSLLGAGWPSMQNAFGVPSSYAGFVSMAIASMTIVSALLSPRIIRKVHTSWIVIISIGLTVAGLLGFSFAGTYWMLFLFAIPYGLGAGAIDTAVNHYVANHYRSSVMNFLHCFYGVGTVISPNVMGLALRFARWNEGYRWTAYLQILILAIVVVSLPLWKKNETASADGGEQDKAVRTAGIRESIRLPGVILTLIAFFTYCAAEATCSLWTSSYFAGTREGLSDSMVASFGSLVFIGLMLGRLVSGFISNKLGDKTMIRIGIFLEITGILFVMIPVPDYIVAAVGFVLAGAGMGPVYPALEHMAPEKYGREHSAAVIGLQMAAGYVGSTFMPMLFGFLQEALSIRILPVYLLILAALTIGLLELSNMMHKKTVRS